jgi:hypothetical protein
MGVGQALDPSTTQHTYYGWMLRTEHLMIYKNSPTSGVHFLLGRTPLNTHAWTSILQAVGSSAPFPVVSQISSTIAATTKLALI